MNSKIIFDFNKEADIHAWKPVNDVIMGGKSWSQFRLNKDGIGVFEGKISLDNNGGFSSLKYQFNKTEATANSKIKIKLKADGKDYQFRVKDNASNYYSYISVFSTTDKWEDIEIDLKDMYPSFRGRRLNTPNFSHTHIEQIVFLIANKKDEDFKLLIDKIELI